jgi:heterodisulfide reductase subunit C
MDHTPRMLFAMIRAGLREEALRRNTPWICVSCYHCVVRCPQVVHIPDVMYTLKSMAIKAKLYRDSTAPDFSQSFVEMVETYGRSYEFGLATRHYLKHYPLRLPSITPMGLGMLSKKRMDFSPHKIQGIDQLHAIALPDSFAGHLSSSHDTSLSHALQVGRRLGVDLPKRIEIVAIVAEKVFDFSEQFSPAVAAAVPGAVQTVLDLLQTLSLEEA